MFGFVVLATAFGSLSQTALNAMLTQVAADLGVEIALAQWLTTAYMLTLGVVVPVSTYVQHRFGVRFSLLVALAFFGAGALVDSLASCFAAALVGRILQAVSTGILMPLVQTISMTRFAPNRRATAMGVAGIALGFAPNIGPTIGGIFVELAGWRSFFLSLVVVAVVLMTAIAAFAHEEEGGENASGGQMAARFDVASFMLSAVGFTGVLLAFSNASSVGVASVFFWAPLGVGGACLAWFVWRQGRIENPLISMGIFASRRYATGFVALVALHASFLGITLVIPLFVEGLLGGSSIDAGLVLLPGTVAALVFNPLAGYLTDRLGARPVALVGGFLLSVGAASMVLFDEATPLHVIVVCQGLRASGVSMLIGPLSSWSLSGLDRRLVADGSSFSVVTRQAAASFGTAVMVLAITAAPALGPCGPALGYKLAFAVSALLALATFACIVAFVRDEGSERGSGKA